MSNRPYLLGLTGSIGMGKSTTAKMFRALDVPVWDADATVAELYARGGAAVEPLRELFPDAVRDGAVDRETLRKIIAADDTALTRIEKIVHPLVATLRAEFIASHCTAPLVVLDIPLLFETGGQRSVDGVLVVTIDAATQRARVLERGTMNETTFEAILARQMPDARKRAEADFVIETRSLEQTRRAVSELVKTLTGQGG